MYLHSAVKSADILNPGNLAIKLQHILGDCELVEFFWSKGQKSNFLIELQGSNVVEFDRSLWVANVLDLPKVDWLS